MMPTLDHTFAALANPTRRAILARLASGEAAVQELAKPFAISLPAVSRHLKVLEQASLIVRDRRGQQLCCRLNAAPLGEAADWLEFYRHFWHVSLDRLADHLASQTRNRPHGKFRRRPR
jgi:DNA-binding transcriptional ArsR family regulator